MESRFVFIALLLLLLSSPASLLAAGESDSTPPTNTGAVAPGDPSTTTNRQSTNPAPPYISQVEKQRKIYREISRQQGMILIRQAREVSDGGDLQKGLNLYRQFIVVYPDHPLILDAWLESASILQRLERENEAVSAYTEAYRLDYRGERGGRAYLNAARILLGEGDYARGKVILQELMEQYPSSAISREAEMELKSLEHFPLSDESLEPGEDSSRYMDAAGSNTGEPTDQK